MAHPSFVTQSSTLTQLALDLPVFTGYKPLDPHKREIRLLSITSPDLNCRLYHASLDDQPTYSALSYYWGAPGATRAVVINHIELHIRKTLHQFIKALYRRCGPLTVWLDVICINQHDLAGKGTQVAMMGDIYSQAQCVYAWLGKGDADTDFAITALQQNGHGLQSSLIRKRVLAGIKQLFLRQYWTRVWIVQECFVNDVLLLVCGASTIAFDELFDAIKNLGTIPQLDSFFEDERNPSGEHLLNDGQDDKVASARLAHTGSGRTSLRAGEKQRLIAWMALFASSDCHEPRDRFYGFRALASDGHLFRVDYTSNTVELLLQALLSHNQSCFIGWCEAHAALRDSSSRDIKVTRLKKRSWWTCPVPANAGPYNKESRALLFDSLCLSEGLRLSKDETLRSLAHCDTDWIVLPIEPYRMPELIRQNVADLQLAPVDPERDSIWDADVARLTAACSYSQRAGVSRYWIVEQSEDVDLSAFLGDWIFVDIDARDVSANCTIFSSAAWEEIGTWLHGIFPIETRETFYPLLPEPAPRHGRSQSLALLETFEDIARGHVWACHITEAVHISCFLFFVFISLQRSNWSSIPAHLVDFGRKTGPPESQKCNCAMPEGVVAPYPPPWAKGMQE